MPGRLRATAWIVSIGFAVALAAGGPVALGQAAGKSAAPAFKPQQQVEVREGDEWSSATVLKREGRKYQIRYQDGTEEWVTADRLRVPGRAGAAPAPAKGADKGKPARKGKAPKEQFKVGEKVEVQSLTGWDKATVRNRDGDLYLVGVDGWDKEFFWKWMHVSSVRKPGTNKKGVSRVQSVGVGNQGVAKAKAEARRLFENIEQELAAEETRGGGGRGASPFEPVPYDKPIADSKLEGAKELTAGEAAPKKLAAFDPAPAKAPKLAQQAYVLKGKGVWPSEAPAAVLAGGTRAAVSYLSGSASDARTLQLELLDLAAGKNLGLVKGDPLSMPVDLSPSGGRLLGRQHGFHSGTRVRVDVFALGKSAAEPTHVVSFIPYVTADFTWKDVEWAAFADDEHVMTLNAGGDLVCWRAADAAARWRMKVRPGSTPARSPGGKQIAVSTDLGLAVLDPLAGRVLCVAPGARPVRALAFTPDGKRVIGTSANTLSGWDLSTGEALPDVGLPAGGTAGEPLALDGRFVLVGGTDLVDSDKKLVVWRYARPAGSGSVVQIGGRTWAVIADGSRNVLAGAALPHAGAVKAADALAAEQALLVKPGDAVSLSVTIEGTAEQQQKIKAAITEQLQQSGIDVADNAPVKLVARTEHGKTREQTYERRGVGAGPWNRDVGKVNVTEKITRIYFEAGGKVAWESRTSGGVPMFVMSKEGQTINDAVQDANKFNLAFLESVRVPAYVPKPTDAPGLGRSKWTVKGIADERPAAAAAGGGDGLD